jgi:glyoxylase-like metal-dependent hydrolase (beta-lactamase superfamily II)
MADPKAFGDRIWLLQVPLEDYDVRGAFVLGDRCAAVWDTLSRPRDMRAFVPLIGARDLVIVYSHADWDHIWGTAGLPYRRARIIAHDRARDRFGTDVPVVLAEKRAAEPGMWDDVAIVPPGESFEREMAIDLGGLTLELRHLPGHTPDCIVGFIAERGLLLAGDTVETPCPAVPADSPLDEWIAQLARWASDERVRSVVPAHGEISGREILHANIAYLEALLSGHPIEPEGPLTPFLPRHPPRQPALAAGVSNEEESGVRSQESGAHSNPESRTLTTDSLSVR